MTNLSASIGKDTGLLSQCEFQLLQVWLKHVDGMSIYFG